MSFKAVHETRILVSGTTEWLSHLRPSICKALAISVIWAVQASSAACFAWNVPQPPPSTPPAPPVPTLLTYLDSPVADGALGLASSLPSPASHPLFYLADISCVFSSALISL